MCPCHTQQYHGNEKMFDGVLHQHCKPEATRKIKFPDLLPGPVTTALAKTNPASRFVDLCHAPGRSPGILCLVGSLFDWALAPRSVVYPVGGNTTSLRIEELMWRLQMSSCGFRGPSGEWSRRSEIGAADENQGCSGAPIPIPGAAAWLCMR
jgi:hypothetical protein